MEQDKPTKSSVIIVRRKQTGHAGHHGGAWKVAYADFVTAMMAFFLVMWLVNSTDVIKKNVAGYFRDPIGFTTGGGGASVNTDEAAVEIPVPQPVEVDKVLQHKAEAILEALSTIPGFEELAGQIEAEMTDEGMRIQLMESKNSTFFDLGGANLSEKGVEALTTIGPLIAPLGYDVVVEGHTDSRPFSSRRAYTNWELSSDRANAARKILEHSGLDPAQFNAIRGYAATRPRFPEDPEDPRNRRISIIVLNPSRDGNDGDHPPIPLSGAANGGLSGKSAHDRHAWQDSNLRPTA